MSIKERTLARYDEAMEQLEIQINLPALATPLNTQQEYNRRKRMEATGKIPTKNVALLKQFKHELALERQGASKAFGMIAAFLKDNLDKDVAYCYKYIIGDEE